MSCVEKIGMGIRMVNGDNGGMLQDPIGEDSVQVERNRNRGGVPDDLPRFFEQVALTIVHVLGSERAVQCKIDPIHRHGGSHGVEKLRTDARKPGAGQRPCRCNPASAIPA